MIWLYERDLTKVLQSDYTTQYVTSFYKKNRNGNKDSHEKIMPKCLASSNHFDIENINGNIFTNPKFKTYEPRSMLNFHGDTKYEKKTKQGFEIKDRNAAK